MLGYHLNGSCRHRLSYIPAFAHISSSLSFSVKILLVLQGSVQRLLSNLPAHISHFSYIPLVCCLYSCQNTGNSTFIKRTFIECYFVLGTIVNCGKVQLFLSVHYLTYIFLCHSEHPSERHAHSYPIEI